MPVIRRPDDDKMPESDWAPMMRALGIGLNFGYGVIGFGLVGWALQRWVWPGAAPWLLLGFCIAGLLSGGVGFVRAARRMNASGGDS